MAETARAFGDFEVVVVGAGAGGAAAAWRLAMQGRRVLVLEAGPRFDPAQDYPLDSPRWETLGFPLKPGSQGRHSFAPMQGLDPAHDTLRSWSRVRGRMVAGEQREPNGPGYHHVRGVGGSTLHFTGEAHRLNPHAMRMASRFGRAADWPFGYAALEPYYAVAERVLGVAGPQDAGDRWRSGPFPLPAHPLSRASRWLGKGAARLGLAWEQNSRAVLSQPYDGRPPCNYCGNCTRGCSRRDKGSADLTFIAQAEASGRCRVMPGTRVVGIVPGEPGRVAALDCVDRAGARFRLPVHELVLAGGAIETPRLLLASAGPQAPTGIGNAGGQVGRHLMETLFWVSVGCAPVDLASYAGLPADAVCWDFNRPDAIPGVIGGCRFSAGIHEADLVGPISHARRIVPGWGRAHKAAMRETLGRLAAVGAIGESLPNASTYVDLDPGERDEDGLPLARIHAHLDEGDIARLAFMAGTARRLLTAAGSLELVEEYGSYDLFAATHVAGTCRMGDDPNRSVVDRDGRVHGWRNLRVCDASVFPSAGGGESPSLTVQALAIRAMDALMASG